MTARLLTLLAARLLVALPLAACAAQPAGTAAGAASPAPAAAAAAGGQDARSSAAAAAPPTAPQAAGANAAPVPAASAQAQPSETAAPARRATGPAATPARAAQPDAAPHSNPTANPAPAGAGSAPADASGTAAPATPPSDVTAPNPAAPGMATPGTAAPGPVTMPAGSSTGSLLQTLLALVLVLAVLGALAWFLKRYGPKAGGGNANLRVVGSLNLGGRERVLVVEVGSQWIVLGASPGRINALATMPRQDGVEGTGAHAQLAPHSAPANSFADWLKQTIDKRK